MSDIIAKFNIGEQEEIKATFKVNAVLTDVSDIEAQIEEKQDKGDYALRSELPTKTSELTNDSGFLTEHQDISNLATKQEVNAKQDKGDYALRSELPTVPTNISAFNNDSGYITNTYHDNSKQNVLTAGENITIENNVISATVSEEKTKLSEFTDDLGTSPIHSHGQYLTEHQDISGKQDVILDLSTIRSNAENSVKLKGSITSSTNLSNLETGMYSINGVTNNDFPLEERMFGTLIQGDGVFKPQFIIGGGAGVSNCYTRRWLTSSLSWTSWVANPTKTSELTNDSGFITVTDYATSTTGGTMKTSGANYNTAVSTSGYLQCAKVDLTDYDTLKDSSFISKGILESKLETKQDTLTSGTNIKTVNNQSLLGEGNISIQSSGTQKYFAITEDIVTVETDPTKGSAPYSTSYGYTNITIDESAGVEWIEGGLYSFIVDTELAVVSAYRNVRVRIGESGDWKPLMATSGATSGSTYLKKSYTTTFQYKTTYVETGGLHIQTDNDTLYTQLSNTVYADTTGSNIKIDDKGYGARYSLVFPTTSLTDSLTDERYSSLVSSGSTGITKKINTGISKFYIDRHPLYVNAANIKAGNQPTGSLYQDYNGMDIRYTCNTDNTYVLARSKAFLWLKNFNPDDMSFEADATNGNIISLSKISTRFPASTTGDIYLYFLGYTTSSWFTLTPAFTERLRIYKYTPSTGNFEVTHY